MLEEQGEAGWGAWRQKADAEGTIGVVSQPESYKLYLRKKKN